MLRILCVDDDGVVLAVTADLLRSLGHDVIEAHGGAAAAEALRDPSVEILVTDIHMPDGPGGVQLAAHARRERPDLPIIFFSGMPYIAPEGVEDIVLRKPCSLGELQQAIAQATTRILRGGRPSGVSAQYR